MKIDKLKINAFGNIQDREIELDEGINLVYGKNEAGKSTLLKFIVDILYGISKNKKGREFSDYDRFKPWNTEEFSGKISYSLDNGKKYEVYRDFNKKNPVVYDEELNDISKDFTIDKNLGNMFFTEQTKIDENTFLSTLASMQTEVKLEKQDQNILVQKIANLAGTGEDNVSYKKALEKINKRQIEEIGTARSQGRPINIVKEEKYKLQDEIGELEEFKDKQYEIEQDKIVLKNDIEQQEKMLKALNELKNVEEASRLDAQKVEFNRNIIQSNNEKIEKLKNEKEVVENELESIKNNKKEEKKSKQKNRLSIGFVILAIILTILMIILKNNEVIFTITRVCLGIDIFAFLFSIILYNNKMKKIESEMEKEVNKNNTKRQEIQNEIEKIDSQIQLLEKNNIEQQQEIEKQGTDLKVEIDNKKKTLLEKYNILNELYNIDYSSVLNKIEEVKSNINSKSLKLHELELDKKNIAPKLEKLAEMEEDLEELNQKEIALNRDNESIELAKEILEIAYIKMKENVTPKFTKELSENIAKISDGKYENVRINDEQGIIVEKENGEYVPSEKLSIGTIEQLYLSLRFSAIKELSQENMPIILDEAFAYYDSQRLENILKYISEEFKQNQIIILTCSKREKEILEKLNIKHKEILL